MKTIFCCIGLLSVTLSNCEVYTSVSKINDVFAIESNVIRALTDYLKKTEDDLEIVKR